MNEFTYSTVEGTGSAINISLGWKPNYVKTINMDATNPVVVEWINGMGAGKGLKITEVVVGDRLNFDAGSDVFTVGATLTGGTSSATATIEDVVVTSGAWGDNDAAGYLILSNVSGAFQNDETITDDGSSGSATENGTLIAPATVGNGPSPEILSTGGITQYSGSSSASTGFTIGTDSELNVNGDTIAYIAMR